MNTTQITENTLEGLARFDTAAQRNALEILRPSYRDKGYTRRPLVAARPGLAPVVGIARGGSIHAEAPSQEPGRCRGGRPGLFADWTQVRRL